MNDEKKPKEYDAVLGGNNSPPVDAAVLGGIEGVRRRLSSKSEEVVIAAVNDAISYGKEGEDLLFEILETNNNHKLWGVLNHLWSIFNNLKRQWLIKSLTKIFKDYEWNQWRENNLNIKINLSGFDFSEIDLTEVNLSQVDFHGVNFQEANLGGVNFCLLPTT